MARAEGRDDVEGEGEGEGAGAVVCATPETPICLCTGSDDGATGIHGRADGVQLTTTTRDINGTAIGVFGMVDGREKGGVEPRRVHKV